MYCVLPVTAVTIRVRGFRMNSLRVTPTYSLSVTVVTKERKETSVTALPHNTPVPFVTFATAVTAVTGATGRRSERRARRSA